MERHHMISLCFPFGIDHESNIIELTKEEHKSLHVLLNIDWSVLRKFRKETNHVFKPDKQYIDKVVVLHNLYFSKFSRLPAHIRDKHLHSMRALANHWYKIHRLQCNSHPKTFHDYLDVFHAGLYKML